MWAEPIGAARPSMECPAFSKEPIVLRSCPSHSDHNGRHRQKHLGFFFLPLFTLLKVIEELLRDTSTSAPERANDCAKQLALMAAFTEGNNGTKAVGFFFFSS